MSFDLRPLREISDSPLEQFTNMLAKKVSIKFQKDTIDQIQESDKQDVVGRPIQTETALKWHPELHSTRIFAFNKKYYPAGDGQVTEMWLRGTNLGNTSKDWSVKFGHEKHTATIYGDPILVDGSIDLGIQTGPEGVKSIARRMNRPRSPMKNQEYMIVPTTEAIQTEAFTLGYSILDRIRAWSLEGQNGKSPTVWVMRDDANDPPTNGRMLQLNDDGRAICIFKRGSTTIAKQTDVNKVQIGQVVEIGTDYDPAGAGDVDIYIDGVLQPLTNFTSTINWPATDPTDLNLHLFHRDLESGHLYADFYDHKEFSDYIVSAEQFANHFENKWTLSNHAFGTVMVTNYWSTFRTPPGGGGGGGGGGTGQGSFSPTSFTTSFTQGAGGGGGGGIPGGAYDYNDYDQNDFD